MMNSAIGLTPRAVAREDGTTTRSHNSGSRSSPRAPARAAPVALACVALACTVLGGAGWAAAQGTVVIGTGLPQVEVHLEALDGIGGTPYRSRLLIPPGASLGTNRFPSLAPILKPPGQRAAIPPPPPQRALPTAPPVPRQLSVAPKPVAPVVATAPPAAPAPRAVAPTAPAPKVTAPKITAPVAPPKTAAVAPSTASAPPATGKMLRFEFSGTSAQLPDDAAGKLALLAEQLLGTDSLRVQVKAYATGSDGSASVARRLSLSRALAVRKFLIEKGVRSTRIDVRAMGNKPEGGPPERVDVVVVKS